MTFPKSFLSVELKEKFARSRFKKNDRKAFKAYWDSYEDGGLDKKKKKKRCKIGCQSHLRGVDL